MFNDLCVEGVTRQPQTSIAQQVCRTSAPLANGRTNADKRKVAGAATEVANKNQLVMLERGFIIVSGGNRLQLELYRFVSRELKCRLETGLGVDVISFFFRPDKMYGPTNHSGSNRGSKLEFSFFAQVPQNAGDKIFKRNATPKDFSSLERTAAEERLERLNQTALGFCRQISLNTFRPCPGFSDLDSSFPFLLKVQERAIGIGQAAHLREVRKLYFA